jgi:hypothetical protein
VTIADDDHFRISRRCAARACVGATPAMIRLVTARGDPHQTAAAARRSVRRQNALITAPPMPTRLANPD